MTFGVKILKNGKRRGYLHFDSGKIVVLNPRDLVDLENKIREWQMYKKLK